MLSADMPGKGNLTLGLSNKYIHNSGREASPDSNSKREPDINLKYYKQV